MKCGLTSGFQMEGKHLNMAVVGQTCVVEFSEYYKGLERNVQARYRQKIAKCDGIDPYCLNKKDFSHDLKDLPNITEVDISNYLVAQTSFYTRKQFSSPDGVVMCSCHGTGACEIKCPHCKQDKGNLSECAGEKGFCLVKEGDDVKLDRNHAYYFQVQAQLHIMEADYCDFVVWNKNDIFVERILPDIEFWDCVIPKVEKFFRQCILPEVLGKQFTKQVLMCQPALSTSTRSGW